MKKYILLLLALPLFLGCSDDGFNNNNKFLPNYNFSLDIDMNLPLYSKLLYPANPVRVNTAGIGINGVIVMNTGSGYTAFEASCPNQPLTGCSSLVLNGILVKCPCDDSEYSLFDGTPAKGDVKFPLKAYRVTVINSTAIRISN